MFNSNETRGPRATSIPWETSSNKKKLRYTITLIRRSKIHHLLSEKWMLLIYKTFKDALCQVSITHGFLKRRYLNLLNVFFFSILLLSTLGKRWGPSYEEISGNFNQECFVVWLIHFSGSGWYDFKILSMYFSYFLIIPLKKGVALHLIKLEFPISKGYFVTNLVEIYPMVLEKKILKFRQCIFICSRIISPWKRRGPSFEQTWILVTIG